jgi:hypothetical protein
MKIFQFFICGRKTEQGNLSLNGSIYEVGVLRSLLIDRIYGEKAHWASHPLSRFIERMEKIAEKNKKGQIN